jgi:hypothetical protein
LLLVQQFTKQTLYLWRPWSSEILSWTSFIHKKGLAIYLYSIITHVWSIELRKDTREVMENTIPYSNNIVF